MPKPVIDVAPVRNEIRLPA